MMLSSDKPTEASLDKEMRKPPPLPLVEGVPIAATAPIAVGVAAVPLAPAAACCTP